MSCIGCSSAPQIFSGPTARSVQLLGLGGGGLGDAGDIIKALASGLDAAMQSAFGTQQKGMSPSDIAAVQAALAAQKAAQQPWYSTTGGMVGIGIGAAVVLGGLGYAFLK